MSSRLGSADESRVKGTRGERCSEKVVVDKQSCAKFIGECTVDHGIAS
jgi:hypothetical protein